MEPKLLKRLEGLFCELMDAAEIRRFINNLFGRQISSQLPAESTHELLAHGTTHVLQRNNLIDPNLFSELANERPQARTQIYAVAEELGFSSLPALVAAGTPLAAVRTPDYVVRDTYENLRAQRTRLRELTHNELHLSRLFGQALRQDDQLLTLPARVTAWIDAHRHEITLPSLQNPIEAIYLAVSVFTADPQVAAFGAMALMFFQGERVLTAIQQVVNFASLTDSQLYELTLKLIETRPHQLPGEPSPRALLPAQ
jgi:hypothetical protein